MPKKNNVAEVASDEMAPVGHFFDSDGMSFTNGKRFTAFGVHRANSMGQSGVGFTHARRNHGMRTRRFITGY
ncbi:unannotated protein [freshwater metagenome]|uniref:Unannotated protein n=1 Tax=freshwater metagenome TaxID=449393 RepID=A0A6J6ZI90_9ZZZZ